MRAKDYGHVYENIIFLELSICYKSTLILKSVRNLKNYDENIRTV